MLAGALALVAVPRLLPRRASARDLVHLRTGLERQFAADLFTVRAMARRAGRVALGATLGVEVPSAVSKAALRMDLVLAKREANRLAGVWGQKFLEATNLPGEKNPAAPILKEMSSRYTLTTEIQASNAWNAERHAAAQSISIEGRVLIKTWSAMGERRTCGVCTQLNGRSILAEDHWPMGDPGTVHPRCRCDECYEAAERWLVERYAA